MAKTDYKSIDDYIAAFPEGDQAVLQAMRAAIHAAVPDAEEAISYQLPAFRYHGWIFYFSAYTDHYAISCPPPFAVFEAFGDQLAGYEISKTAVKFPKSKPVPLTLIGEMSAFRARENLQRASGKRAGKG
ncbi:iron chaperone [Sphingomonas sp.]|uniref:iron chaperone n=1 Tax=Sphingomonas sp. TaxID=28214 RepID=UPI003D6D19DC